MEIGDNITVSDKNPNHLGYGVSAYAGMTGIVDEIWEDGSFAIKTETNSLIVPLNKRGFHIILNSKEIYLKEIKKKPQIIPIKHHDGFKNILKNILAKFSIKTKK